MDTADDPRMPLLGTTKEANAVSVSRPPSSPPSYNVATSSPPDVEGEDAEMDLQNMSRKSQWIILAVASGACASFNGVFAKL